MVELAEHLALALVARDRAGLRRALRPLSGVGPRVRDDGRVLLNFSSNDYLGLAADPRLRAALRDAMATESQSVGAPASRLITGSLDAHDAIEAELASWVRMPAALLQTSGYTANVGALAALAGPDDVIFSDALNHASLIDGARLSRARVEVFPHCDVDALDRKLRAARGRGAAWVVTDALFSMDGDAAPLEELARVARAHDAWLYVDEAHALGVLGPEGAGLCAARGVQPDVLVGTLGKAVGVSGAFVAGSATLREWLVNASRSFVFSTAYPAALLPALAVSVPLVRAADGARATLSQQAQRLRAGLRARALDVRGAHAIVPVVLGSNERALDCAATLERAGVLGLAIRPPTVPPATARVRLSPMASHTSAEIEAVLEAFDTFLAAEHPR